MRPQKIALAAIALAAFIQKAGWAANPDQNDPFRRVRDTMVARYISSAGVSNNRVLDAMRATPRHEFVPKAVRRRAYRDVALPIGYGQTISSPYIVAMMTERIDPQPTDRVLEVGTGSGYQAAVLSPLVKEVFTIEIVPELGKRASTTLQQLNYANVQTRVGDGYKGWKEYAPFDKIIVTCSPEDIPQPLIDQLVDGGHLVIPVGERYQQTLFRYTKTNGKLVRERLESTFFVPMTGQAESERSIKPTGVVQILNGDFENTQRCDDGDEPTNWYYVRQAKLQARRNGDGQYLAFNKSQPSELAHALQSFGVDGRKSSKLRVSMRSRGRNLETGLISIDASQLVVEFYDDNRAPVGQGTIAVKTGSFDWQISSAVIDVPQQARLAVVGVGLFGVTGELSVDDVILSDDVILGGE